MKIIIKLFAFIFQLGLIILILGSVLTLVSSKTAIISGIRSFVVVSGSMRPAFDVGSIVFTKSNDNYQKGDIVAFNNKSNQVVTHRIVNKATIPQGTFYEMKGDANNTPDGDPVEEKSIIGRSILVIPFIGLIVQFLKTAKGFIGLVIAPSALFIIWELWNIKRELEKEVERKILNRYNKLNFS